MKRLLLIASVSLLILGCNKESASPEGGSQMVAKIDGVDWASTFVLCMECRDVPTPYILCDGYYEKNGQMQSHISFSFPTDFEVPDTINYPVPGDSSGNYLILYQDITNSLTYRGISGELVITSYEGIRGRIQGTFNFQVVEVISGSDTINITEGNFNILIGGCQ